MKGSGIFHLFFLLGFCAFASQGADTTPSINDILSTYQKKQKKTEPSISFQSQKIYECISQYRLMGDFKTHQELSPRQKEKSRFQLLVSENYDQVKTSENLIYTQSKNSGKGKLYSKIAKIDGKNLVFKLRLSKNNGLYKSIAAPGYGNLLHDYVLCQLKDK